MDLESIGIAAKEFMDLTDALITKVDAEGNFLFVNNTSKKIFGLSPEECIGKSAFDFIHPNDREPTMKEFEVWIREKFDNIVYENRQVSNTGKVSEMR